MRSFTFSFQNESELADLLREDATVAAIGGASSVLAQLYTGICDTAWIASVRGRLIDASDKIVLAGATSFGEIAQGQVLNKSNVLSLICFDDTTLVSWDMECARGSEQVAAAALGDGLNDIAQPVQGVLLLGTTLSMDCSVLLETLHECAPQVPVFGGGAADNGLHSETFVFSRARTISCGFVAVALCGDALDLIRRSYLGWERMGNPMTITRADRFVLHSIDDRPAFEVYRHYLGIEADDRFFFNAMEFPFLVERNGELVARVPNAVDDNGAIHFVADLTEGERIEFGYAHVDTLRVNVAETLQAIRAFEPETIALFSCGCRHFVMQDDVKLELAPFQAIAPTAGLFTYGEFCSFDSHSTLLNSALVVIGMRENGDSAPRLATKSARAEKHASEPVDIYGHNHMRVLSRFQHFMKAVTDDLEKANAKLADLADYDYLTGLYNRRRLEARLSEEIERCRRHDRNCCVLFADIDCFKQLNDSYGHSAGDRVLQSVAEQLISVARKNDMACRYGGEEFVLMMSETTIDQAKIVAEKLRNRIETLVMKHNGVLLPTVTMSFGISCYANGFASAADLLAVADEALYRAKRSGRNRVFSGLN